jgi:Cu/Ag efflux pump CusA
VAGILVLLQAAFGSWSLATAVLLTLPIALAGSAIAAAATGAALSLGSLAGLLTVFGIAVRHAILLINRYQTLRKQAGLEFDPALVVQGTRERAAPNLTAAVVIAAAVLPFAVFGTMPGHEILGPMAVVILGGLFTATLYTMCVIPALYARLGASVSHEAIEDDDLTVPSMPEFQQI